MGKPPAFQFYTSDFLTGTAHFKPEEVGAYIRLLCYQWDKGWVSEEDFEALSGLELDRLKKVIKKFEKGTDGLFRNKRLEATRKEYIQYREKQSLNGKLGGRPPKAKETQAFLEEKPNETQDETQPKAKKTSSPSPSPSSTSLTSTSSSDKEKQATKKSSRWFVPLRDKFLSVVEKKGMDYYFTAKDGAALKAIESKIIFLYKSKNEDREPTEKQVVDAWEHLLTTTKMKFVLENFTVPIINSKWNEIINDLKELKNGKQQHVSKQNQDKLNRIVSGEL